MSDLVKMILVWVAITAVAAGAVFWFRSSPDTETVANECIIKGNINQKGQKIYHLPEDKFYQFTEINENNGEQWFCTEEDAVDAGWRRSQV